MEKVQRQVLEFHRTYGVPEGEKIGFPTFARQVLRERLIREEFEEYLSAVDKGDFVEAIDALGDLLFVIYGTAVEFGVDMEPVMDEISRSNLSKLGALGVPLVCEDGKILKGPNYTPPDIAAVLRGLSTAP